MRIYLRVDMRLFWPVYAISAVIVTWALTIGFLHELEPISRWVLAPLGYLGVVWPFGLRRSAT